MAILEWDKAENLPSRTYSCAYCGHEVASNQGYVTSSASLVEDEHHIYICPFCCGPTYFRPDGTRFPDMPFGHAVKYLPSGDLEALYNEARTALSVNACTAAVLCCKKILVYISVNKGAPPGRPFQEYIDYLNGNGYVPPDAQDWVDRVQKIGGNAGHKIEHVTRHDAEVWLTLIEALLRFMFEYPTILSDHRKRFSST